VSPSHPTSTAQSRFAQATRPPGRGPVVSLLSDDRGQPEANSQGDSGAGRVFGAENSVTGRLTPGATATFGMGSNSQSGAAARRGETCNGQQLPTGCHWRLVRQCDGQGPSNAGRTDATVRGGYGDPPRSRLQSDATGGLPASATARDSPNAGRTDATARGGYGDPPRSRLQSGATGGLSASAMARDPRTRAERMPPSAVGTGTHRAAGFNRVPPAACPPVRWPGTPHRVARPRGRQRGPHEEDLRRKVRGLIAHDCGSFSSTAT
jgi:hypothetical protein